MRTATFVGAAAQDFDVKVIVVPVSGVPASGRSDGEQRSPAELRTISTAGLALQRSAAVSLFADPKWRVRLLAASPLPEAARAASPGLAPSLGQAVGELISAGGRGVPVHVVRSYLAPLGIALAERLGSTWATLDLDDDDESFYRSIGAPDEAEAYGRLVGTFAREFSGVAVASPGDAAELRARHGFELTVVPNSVPATDAPPIPQEPPCLLFVANLDYAPNEAAASILAERILPAVRAATGLAVTVAIAGPFGPESPVARLDAIPGVRLLGFVDDLSALYAQGTLVVAPLPFGSGTKIKVLEAFARGVPVVTTVAGAAGLEVTSGVHLLVGSDERQLVDHTVTLLRDGALAASVATRAKEYVERSHSPSVGAAAVRRFLSTAAAAPKAENDPGQPR
jgi:hypothetical protein